MCLTYLYAYTFLLTYLIFAWAFMLVTTANESSPSTGRMSSMKTASPVACLIPDWCMMGRPTGSCGDCPGSTSCKQECVFMSRRLSVPGARAARSFSASSAQRPAGPCPDGDLRGERGRQHRYRRARGLTAPRSPRAQRSAGAAPGGTFQKRPRGPGPGRVFGALYLSVSCGGAGRRAGPK